MMISFILMPMSANSNSQIYMTNALSVDDDGTEHGYFPLSQMNIKKVQVGLSGLGYDVGAIDGDFGPRTIKAIKSFQRDNGLPVTGKPDGEFRSKFNGKPDAIVAIEKFMTSEYNCKPIRPFVMHESKGIKIDMY